MLLFFGNDNDAVLAGNDDVAGSNLDAGTIDFDIAGNAGVAADAGTGAYGTGKDRKAERTYLSQIAYAAIHQHAGHAAALGRSCHQPPKSSEVERAIDYDYAHFAWFCGIDHADAVSGGKSGGGILRGGRAKHRRGRTPYKCAADAGAHVVIHVAALACDLIDGIGHGRNSGFGKSVEEGIGVGGFGGLLESDEEDGSDWDWDEEEFFHCFTCRSGSWPSGIRIVGRRR